MKTFALLILSSFLAQGAFAACDPEAVKSEAAALASSDSYRATISRMKVEGTLKPGEKMNVVVAVDDFDMKNDRKYDLVVVSFFGNDWAGDDAYWLGMVDPESCKLMDLKEVLHTGGGGL